MDSGAQSSMVVALDIGTSKIACAVADVNERGELKIVGIGKVAANGIQDGSVQDVESAVESIRLAKEEAEAMSGREITMVSTALTGKYLHSVNREGRLVLGENEVTTDDVQRVTRLAMAFDPKVDGRSDDDRVVAHIVKGYTLDNDNVLIEDPVGMMGSVIRSHVHLAVGSESIVANLVKCIRRVGLDVEALILQPWASAASCVTPTEKELGVIVMDFGAGAIDLVCFEHSEIEKTQVIPAGGELIRRDIAGVFECSLDDAEEIKRAYGHIGPRPEDKYEKIRYTKEASGESAVQTCEFLEKIVSMRAGEILRVIKENYIDPERWTQKAAAGIVITGGMTEMPGFPELVQRVMGLPVRIGTPRLPGEQAVNLTAAEDSTVTGVLLETVRRRRLSGRIRRNAGRFSGLMGVFRRVVFGDFAG